MTLFKHDQATSRTFTIYLSHYANMLSFLRYFCTNLASFSHLLPCLFTTTFKVLVFVTFLAFFRHLVLVIVVFFFLYYFVICFVSHSLFLFCVLLLMIFFVSHAPLCVSLFRQKR